MCFAPERRAFFRHLNVKKWSALQFFTLLTWKCASRYKGVHFFEIAIFKSGSKLVCFVHFDLEMCFGPQRRALFDLFGHLNFRKWSETSQLLTLLTRKRASRHNGVHFFDISTSKSGPMFVCFVHFDLEMCFARQRCPLFHHSSSQMAPHRLLFDPGATNHGKNAVNRDFPTFSRTCIFLRLTLSLL